MSAVVPLLRERPAYLWGIRVMRLAGLAALLAATARARPPADWHGRGPAISCVLGVTAGGWLLWLAGSGAIHCPCRWCGEVLSRGR